MFHVCDVQAHQSLAYCEYVESSQSRVCNIIRSVQPSLFTVPDHNVVLQRSTRTETLQDHATQDESQYSIVPCAAWHCEAPHAHPPSHRILLLIELGRVLLLLARGGGRALCASAPARRSAASAAFLRASSERALFASPRRPSSSSPVMPVVQQLHRAPIFCGPQWSAVASLPF